MGLVPRPGSAYKTIQKHRPGQFYIFLTSCCLIYSVNNRFQFFQLFIIGHKMSLSQYNETAALTPSHSWITDAFRSRYSNCLTYWWWTKLTNAWTLFAGPGFLKRIFRSRVPQVFSRPGGMQIFEPGPFPSPRPCFNYFSIIPYSPYVVHFHRIETAALDARATLSEILAPTRTADGDNLTASVTSWSKRTWNTSIRIGPNNPKITFPTHGARPRNRKTGLRGPGTEIIKRQSFEKHLAWIGTIA